MLQTDIIDMTDITHQRLGRFPKNLNLIPAGIDKIIRKTKSSFKSASDRHNIHGSHIRYKIYKISKLP